MRNLSFYSKAYGTSTCISDMTPSAQKKGIKILSSGEDLAEVLEHKIRFSLHILGRKFIKFKLNIVFL